MFFVIERTRQCHCNWNREKFIVFLFLQTQIYMACLFELVSYFLLPVNMLNFVSNNTFSKWIDPTCIQLVLLPLFVLALINSSKKKNKFKTSLADDIYIYIFRQNWEIRYCWLMCTLYRISIWFFKFIYLLSKNARKE